MPAAASARALTYDSPPTPDSYTESEPDDLPALVENWDSLTMGWYLQSLQPPSLRPPLPTPTQPTPAQLSRQHAITAAQLSPEQPAPTPAQLSRQHAITAAQLSPEQPAPTPAQLSRQHRRQHAITQAQLSRQQANHPCMLCNNIINTQSVPSQSTTAEPELLPPMHMLMASGGVAQYEINTFGVELPGPDGTSVTLEELDAFGQHLLPPPPLTNHHNIDTTNNITTQRFHQIIHLPLHFRGVRAEYNYFTSNSPPPPPTYYQPLTNTPPPPPVVYDWMHSLLPHHQHQNSSSSTDTYAPPEVPPPPFDTPPASPHHHHYQQYIWEDDDLGMRMTWTQLDESEGE